MYLQLKFFFLIYVSVVNCMDGGPRAAVGEFKYMVSIWNHEVPLCAGAIIHKSFVLTAAHCTFHESVFNIFVYAGFIDLEDPNLIIKSVRKVHPYYNTETIVVQNPERFYLKNDLALLEIDIAFTWGDTIGPIPLPEIEQWNPCEPCLVPGWDAAISTRRSSLFLLSVYASVYSDAICRRFGITLLTNEKCAHDDFGASIAVQGDSGGPFVCRGAVAGIIVRGHNQPNKPTVILSVHPYLQFIYQIIRDDKVDAKPQEFPYAVSIWSGNNYLCGGTIFDKFHVITMAHRVKTLKKSDLRVLAGKDVIPGQYSTGYWSTVERVDLYLHYEKEISRITENNIAIFKLTTALVWSPSVKPAYLLPGADVYPGANCEVLQWSLTNEWGSKSRKLVWSPAVVLSKQRCGELRGFLASNEFCATSIHGYPLAFKEDSGNPIVCDGVVVGIIASVPDKFSLFAASQVTFIRLGPYMKPINLAEINN